MSSLENIPRTVYIQPVAFLFSSARMALPLTRTWVAAQELAAKKKAEEEAAREARRKEEEEAKKRAAEEGRFVAVLGLFRCCFCFFWGGEGGS